MCCYIIILLPEHSLIFLNKMCWKKRSLKAKWIQWSSGLWYILLQWNMMLYFKIIYSALYHLCINRLFVVKHCAENIQSKLNKMRIRNEKVGDRKKQKRSQHVSFPITQMSYVELKHLHTGHSQVIQKWQLNLQGRNEPSLLIFLSKYFNLLGKSLISVFWG